MRILLDENLDWRLKRYLTGHTVESVALMSWSGLKNGDLLRRAEIEFDVFVTMDSNMMYQQSLQGLRMAVIVLQSRSNRLADTRDLMPKVLAAVESLRPGTVTCIS